MRNRHAQRATRRCPSPRRNLRPPISSAAASCSRWARAAWARPPSPSPRCRDPPAPSNARRPPTPRRRAIARRSTSAITTAPPGSRRRKDHAAHQEKRRASAAGPRLRRLVGSTAPDDGSADVPEALGPRRRGRGVREPAAVRRDRQGRGRRRKARPPRPRSSAPSARTARSAARSTRRSRTASGRGRSRCSIRRSTSARTAPRARRCASTATASHRLKTPMKLVNGKYQKISWEQAINEVGDKLLALRKESRTRRGVLGRQLQAQQRAGVPDAQVRVVLGHQQLRPPGAHLPLDDGRRRSQHLGLRRDDQLVQRHAEHQVRDVHRQQRGRSAPGVDAAHAAREGNRREDDRRRSALHAHRGEGRRVRAHPLRHRHPVPVRHALPHLQERLGRQAVHPRPRLRHGQGQGRGPGQVDAGQGRGSLRRPRGAGATRSPR